MRSKNPPCVLTSTFYRWARSGWRLREFSPDVVLFNDQRDLRLGVIAAGLAGVPLKLQRKGWSFLKGSARDRFYYNRLDAVACVSHDIEKLFADKLRRRRRTGCSICPMG